MPEIFPFLQPDLYTDATGATDAGPYRDVAWDYAADKPRFTAAGEPLVVSGLEAVKSWAWRALHTERFLDEIHSWDYGNEIMTLAGQQWIREVKEAEAVRYVSECLTQHPDISGISDASATFEDGTLTVRCTAVTAYGDARMEVNYDV